MSLSDEIEKEHARRRKSEIERVIEQLDGADLIDFINALNNEDVPPSALSRAINNRGYLLDARRISEYRNNNGRVRYGLDGNNVTR
jgi:hypothetical protein